MFLDRVGCPLFALCRVSWRSSALPSVEAPVVCLGCCATGSGRVDAGGGRHLFLLEEFSRCGILKKSVPYSRNDGRGRVPRKRTPKEQAREAEPCANLSG